MRAQIVVRARYAEDRLDRAVAQGITQYLILAAGLDTFALRRRELGGRLRVFEIDHPDTQRWKRGRLRGRIPSNLRFVAVNFERESVAEALRRSRFDPRLPAFVSWLGTTYYLSREAILGTLASLRSVLAPGSELVLDYWSKDPRLDARARWLLAGVQFMVAMQREPMKSFFTPRQIEREIAGLGLQILQHATPADQRSAYLGRRTDALDVPDFAYLLHLRFP
jgi:methyltransferase (TIGR00027 family)